MEDLNWQEAHRSLLMRLCGVFGIAFIALAFVDLGGPYFDSDPTPRVVSWVQHNQFSINFSGVAEGFTATLMFLFIVTLVAFAGRGLLASVANGAAAAVLAIDWVQAGAYFGLADVGQRQQAVGGVLALFSVVKTLTFADGLAFGLAATAVSVVAMRAYLLPRPLIWLGLAVGVFHLVELPLQLAVSGTPGGFTGPIGAITGLVWVLAVSVALLIRPTWNAGRVTAAALG